METARDLVQIVDAALAEAARKAGPWLACKPGCTPCCYGPFPITPADAARLLNGLAALSPERATVIRLRARESVARLEAEYPGDTLARLLSEDEEGAADAEPCPALDPISGFCELYDARPVICRTFGPPLHFAGQGLGVCELCFEGATADQIAACEVEIPIDNPEESPKETIIAYLFASNVGAS